MRRFISTMILTLVIGGALLLSPGWRDGISQTQGGGTIEGTIVFVGTPPKDEYREVAKDQRICGSSLPAEKYLIAKDGGIQNAIVSVEGLREKVPLPQEGPVIRNLKCSFTPHVSVGYVGGQVTFRNDDPLLHNVHLFFLPGGKTFVNFAMPFQGRENKKLLKKAGLYEIKCDVHAYMQGYLYVAEHPYVAVTDENGRFAFAGVPTGKYTLKAWHEAFGEVVVPVNVTTEGTARVTLRYDKKS